VADGTSHALGERLGEWFLRTQVLRAARAQLPRPEEQAGHAFVQVRLLREIARQVAEPVDELPAGRRPAVLLILYRDIVYWALIAERRGAASIAPDLATLWQQTPGDKLLRAAGGADDLEALRGLLVDLRPIASLEATDEQVARVRAFADNLYGDVEAPVRRVGRILIQRWLRLAAVVVAVLAIAFTIRAIARGPNLATLKPFRVSSMLPECLKGDEGCRDVMFHTREEDNPWVEFDLGGTKRIHLIEVKNRVQCCQERALPLVAEISADRTQWKEVARRTTEFSTWTVKLPPTPAAYVRLRVPRPTYLHLVDVTIR
jgi:hypothetical protein